MKLKIIITSLFFTACNLGNDNPNVFHSENLKGKYKVDLTPFVTEAVKSEEGDDTWEKIGKGFGRLAFSSVDMKLIFYSNNKGIMSVDGGLINLVNAFSDKPVEKLGEFTYKVEHDSILFMKFKEDKEYRKWAIVRKFSENYDYLQFLIVEEGKDKVFFNLKKIGE